MTELVRTCKGTKKDGNPCGSSIVDPNGYCFAHGRSPMQVAENARKAAAISADVRRELAKTVRERLREEIEDDFAAVWGAFKDALVAKTTDGDADHRARVQAAIAVLDQAYGRPPQQLVGDVDKPLQLVVRSAFRRDELDAGAA